MQNSSGLLSYLQESPTPFHATQNAHYHLKQAGFSYVSESSDLSKLASGKYYFMRNDSALIAVNLNKDSLHKGFRLIGAHTDSPCLKIKPSAILEAEGYVQLAVEVYGGALLSPWFDRDLSLAGRVTFKNEKSQIQNTLIDFKKPIAFIPSLAIHLDRKANSGRNINKQNHLPPIIALIDESSSTSFPELIRNQIKSENPSHEVREILSFELSLYDQNPPAYVGLKNQFIASARLDNLLSCYAGLVATANTANKNHNQLLVLNDHEEVGSSSSSGADGNFLTSILARIAPTKDILYQAINNSIMLSVDNAHGVHPNFADLHDPAHKPIMNKGIAIKYNSNQRYATNSETSGMFQYLCQSCDVPYQLISVRSDLGCGSTIGPISASKTGIKTIDIGVPQLGMHSIREICGEQDTLLLIKVLTEFLECESLPFPQPIC